MSHSVHTPYSRLTSFPQMLPNWTKCGIYYIQRVQTISPAWLLPQDVHRPTVFPTTPPCNPARVVHSVHTIMLLSLAIGNKAQNLLNAVYTRHRHATKPRHILEQECKSTRGRNAPKTAIGRCLQQTLLPASSDQPCGTLSALPLNLASNAKRLSQAARQTAAWLSECARSRQRRSTPLPA